MTALRLLLLAALTGAAGAAIVGLIRLPLRLLERVALSAVLGIVGGTAVSIALALVLGINAGTVLGGPFLLLLAALAASRATGDPRGPWAAAGRETMAGWREGTPWALIVVLAVAAVSLTLLFAHGIQETGGGIAGGYSTVWSDWSHHHTRAASFSVAGNVPPVDPLFGDTPLRYPFLPDFHTAMLEVLGAGPALSYALPGVVLLLAIVLLVISLSERLGAGLRAGVIAVAICLLGGGLGFAGILADACAHHGLSADQCSLAHMLRSPADGVTAALGTLHDLPGLVAAQPRAYDGLETDAAQLVIPNTQWYTPLMDWWLPQISLPFGFAVALSVLLLMVVALRDPGRDLATFAIGGAAVGLLPLIHVHTLIALGLVLGVMALGDRRRAWLVLGGTAAVIAVPRLVQLGLGPHGTAAAGNQFPWIEPGWKWDASSTGTRIDASASGFLRVVEETLRLPVTPGWWQFWVLNLGVAVPLCAVLLLAAAARSSPGGVGAAGRRVLDAFPPELVRFCLPFMLVFAAASVIVFQSWDWDNTKVLVYWYLAVALLIGALVSRWLSAGGWWRPAAGALILAATLLTGVLVVLRLLPWTPPADSVTGPFTLATASERRLAGEVAGRTPRRALFLTPGRTADPVLTLAGRTSLMGYYGWVWTYGVDFGTRPEDIRTMYRGCASVPPGSCRVPDLLRRYGIDFVEVDDRLGDTGVLERGTDLGWWSSQGFPIVAGDSHIVIYDVRHR